MQARWGQALSATLNLIVGLVAARWLWRQPWAERVSGVLLVLLGLNQFWFAALGAAGVVPQASIGTVLRTCLGLTLLYAALRRSGEAAQALRDQYLRMTENAHHGVVVIQDDRVPYANQAARRIFNVAAELPIAVPWDSVQLAAHEPEAARRRHRALLAGETDHVQWEGPRLRHDGRAMYLRFSRPGASSGTAAPPNRWW